MEVRNAERKDMDAIMKIYEYARAFMAQNGNPTQWKTTYPPEEIVRQDIDEGNCYVCVENGVPVGVFFFLIGEEPTYREIEEGSWGAEQPCGVIHRVASGGARGVAKCCFDFCKSRISYLRIDTHADNLPMQKALLKNGFQRRGVIYVEDGSPRIAFDFIS